MNLVRCFLGLGANLGDKMAGLKKAIALLKHEKDIRVRRTAPFYRTAPWGYADQDWFINTVVEIETSLSPQQLLNVLLAIEEKMGRVRGVRWGPRVIDLDLLLYGDTVLNQPGLIIPHPRMAGRAFVLAPLADLEPDLVIPGCGRVADLYKAIEGRQAVEKI